MKKMSLNEMKSLSHKEMKKIMAGSGSNYCNSGNSCTYYEAGTGNVTGTCQSNSNNDCVCGAQNSSVVSSYCRTGQ